MNVDHWQNHRTRILVQIHQWHKQIRDAKVIVNRISMINLWKLLDSKKKVWAIVGVLDAVSRVPNAAYKARTIGPLADRLLSTTRSTLVSKAPSSSGICEIWKLILGTKDQKRFFLFGQRVCYSRGTTGTPPSYLWTHRSWEENRDTCVSLFFLCKHGSSAYGVIVESLWTVLSIGM